MNRRAARGALVLRLACVAAAVAAAAAAAGLLTAAALGNSSRRVNSRAAQTALGVFRSAALDSQLHFLIRLPAGYGSSGRRYPVIYFLHGLPAGPTSYQSLTWLGQALDRAGGQAILVVPQGTRRDGGDPEYLDWGPGHDWATALAAELPAYIDAHYRTIASRGGRAIVGVSAGGYGATTLGLQHPGTFSVVESWSGYFEPTDPTGKTVLDLGSSAANAQASVHALVGKLGKQFRRYPTLLAFYVGRSDPTFVEDNLELNSQLTSAGVRHTFATYPGAHTLALWQAHATDWLAMALEHLAPIEV